MFRVLIFGGKGWIGKKVAKIFEDDANVLLKCSENRADDFEKVAEELDEFQPTNVVCLVGRTHGTYEGQYIPTIDYLEKKGKLTENIRDNLFSPVGLAMLCKERNIHFTYMGTGCIFSYTEDKKLFTEAEQPNFFGSSYSVVKGFTDRLMHLPSLQSNSLNVRIRMPISSDDSPRNFIVKLLKYQKICSMPNSMTVLDELLPVFCDMVKTKKTGTINLTNPGVIEHSEILDLYRDMIDPTFKYELFSYEEQMKVIACDRSNNELDTTLLKTWYPSVKSIKDSVKEVLSTFGLTKKV